MTLKILSERVESIYTILHSFSNHQKEYLTLKEASGYLSLSESLLYKLKDAGKIPFYKPNGKIFFKRAELDAWINKSRVSSEEEMLNAYFHSNSKGVINKNIPFVTKNDNNHV